MLCSQKQKSHCNQTRAVNSKISISFRWRSADGNDYLCGHCQSQNEIDQTRSKPSKTDQFSPRGFGKPDKPETFWRSGLETNKGSFLVATRPLEVRQRFGCNTVKMYHCLCSVGTGGDSGSNGGLTSHEEKWAYT